MKKKPEPAPPLTEGEVQERLSKGEFGMAETSVLDAYGAETARIIDAINATLQIRVTFLSDLSSLLDFSDEPEFFRGLGERLGISVGREDSILELCYRLRAGRAN